MDLPNRRPNRLPIMDYSASGVYFVTVCTQDRLCILSTISGEAAIPVGEGLCALPQTHLTPIGKETEKAILHINSYDGYEVDKYTIMPNHIHLLISIHNETGGHRGPPLQAVIGRLKSYTTHLYGKALWQRSFHDHIVRDMDDYVAVWQYIDTNPLKWHLDTYYSEP